MTPDTFRLLALSLPGVEEKFHQGHADFRVRGRIFATLGYPDEGYGMVKLSEEEQARRVRQVSGVFSAAKGAWGAQGSTLVRLEGAAEPLVLSAIRAAWERLVREESAAKPKPGAGPRGVRPKRSKI
jgi:hypothetical protein